MKKKISPPAITEPDVNAGGDQTQNTSTPRSTTFSRGPWKVCGANNERCRCGQIWSIPEDGPVANVTIGKWGDDYASLRFVGGDSAGTIGARVEAYEDQITYGEVSDELAFANAHLIAAAPQMLDALETVRALQFDHSEDVRDRVATEVEAAIRQATSVPFAPDSATASFNPKT